MLHSETQRYETTEPIDAFLLQPFTEM